MSESSIPENPVARIPATKTEARAVELFSEVRGLFAQWSEEVPNGRKAWPESIKKRIMELWALGVSTHQIAEEAGVPAQTLYSWRQKLKKSGFLQVTVSKRPGRRTRFQIEQDQTHHKDPLQPLRLESLPTTSRQVPMTLVLGDQLRIEGVTEDFALKVARELMLR